MNSCGYDQAVLHKGFTLVELMVALLIGLIITFGATQVFVSGKQAFSQAESLHDRQESFRYLVDSMSYDIRNSTSFGIEANSSRLKIDYVGRPANSVCPGNLAFSIYYYEESGSAYVDSDCSDPEPISSGISDLSFTYILGLYGVVSEITLSDPGGRLPNEIFEVRVANRGRVIDAVEGL